MPKWGEVGVFEAPLFTLRNARWQQKALENQHILKVAKVGLEPTRF